MAAYVIVQANVTNPEQYQEYRNLATIATQVHGGKFLARGGAATDLEGTRQYQRLVVIEFPSVDQAKAWYASPEYQKAKKAREGAGVAVFTVVEGI